MTHRPPPVTIEAADLELLRLGTWRCLVTDRRSKRLARLRLCESTANEIDAGQHYVHWRTTDKGRLLARSTRIAL